MSALHRPAPPERTDPVVLLIDAVINRQADLAQRLGQQWIHRHGVRAFETLSRTRLLQICGDDGTNWLHDQLGLANPGQPERATPAPEPASLERPLGRPLGSLIREALSEALQPLRQDSANDTRPQPIAQAAAADPWQWSPLPSGNNASKDAAPPPADLAALRAWLHSDAA